MTRTTTKPTNANMAVIYCRVSTEEQAIEGISLDAQEARLRAYCELRGLTVAAVVVDAGVSAGKPLAAREGGARVLDAVRKGEAGAVVALKLDRLFRNAADCLTVVDGWNAAGVAFHLVDLGGQAVDTSTAMGRFFLVVMAGAAEMERNLVCERTATAMAYKRSRSEFCGGRVPYGYRLDVDAVHLVEDDAEQSVMRAARKLRAAGLSLRKVGVELTSRGFLPRSGYGWHAETVKALLVEAA